jgi:hypothetical protein
MKVQALFTKKGAATKVGTAKKSVAKPAAKPSAPKKSGSKTGGWLGTGSASRDLSKW